ncbi:hypothetical protein F183_A03920 [Bryobacterales bacterium F-183]|nr:hypothetical protein F183_A03920 [Bryobacterales bacterium F-183]
MKILDEWSSSGCSTDAEAFGLKTSLDWPMKCTMRCMATKKAPKNSLVANINKRKKAGTSRSKEDSTVSKKAYEDMQAGWPKSRKRRKSSSSS